MFTMRCSYNFVKIRIKSSHILQMKLAQLDLRCLMSSTPNEAEQSSFDANPKTANKCVVCGNVQGLWACDAFKKLNPSDRYKKVKEAKLCFLCLRSKHPAKDCKMKECGIDGCQKRHNRLLHRSDPPSKLKTKTTETVETHASVSFTILVSYQSVKLNYQTKVTD